jgi:hypothetical protein
MVQMLILKDKEGTMVHKDRNVMMHCAWKISL